MLGACMQPNNVKKSRSSILYIQQVDTRTLEGAAFASLNNYSNVKEGYVYIVSNPAWEGWYKVGMAIDAYDRCSGYQTSSPFRDYAVEYCKYFEDRRESEQNIHTKLAEQKIERRGEWFRGSLTDIKSKLSNNINMR